ncbi:MAG: glycosyltransferase [Patescibacteria group bacterium]
MTKVSVVIPTFNRSEFLKHAIQSVLDQTFQDFEIIVVDDGDIDSASVVEKFSDSRITYIQHQTPRRGGSAARNTGIKVASAPLVAFLDDDDTWVPEKLQLQYDAFRDSDSNVGFCFSGIKKLESSGMSETTVEEGLSDLHITALTRFKGYMTSTLLIKKNVFDVIGFFDERLPSHQEAELVLRISQKFKGIGLNKPLATVNMLPHEHIGGDIERRIKGRELLLEKHSELFSQHPRLLAKHYFWIGLWYRDLKQYKRAREYFEKSLKFEFNARVVGHFLSVSLKEFL